MFITTNSSLSMQNLSCISYKTYLDLYKESTIDYIVMQNLKKEILNSFYKVKDPNIMSKEHTDYIERYNTFKKIYTPEVEKKILEKNDLLGVKSFIKYMQDVPTNVVNLNDSEFKKLYKECLKK